MNSCSENFPRAGVIGWPIAHSRSPIIHEFWLKENKLPGRYDKIAVAPEELDGFFSNIKISELSGANITIPHKEVALHLCDELETIASEIGAVNTIWLESGVLKGTNTDAFGFVANLNNQVPEWDAVPGPAIVLGAGGAARAVIWALANQGFDPVHIVNRTAAKAENMARYFSPVAKSHGWDKLEKLSRTSRILVNTTSLGMIGQPKLVVDLSLLPENAVVCDLVYVPLETDLLLSAKERNLRFADGLGMLLHQAVPGFEKWFGMRPNVSERLRSTIIANLGEFS